MLLLKSISLAVSLFQEAREAFYMKNYPDWFASVGKSLVKKSDGTFVVMDELEIEEMKNQNRITLEIPKTKGGQVVDYTQRPIMVLKDKE